MLKPTIIALKCQIDSFKQNEFAIWQGNVNAEVTSFTGFSSLEFHINQSKEEWIIVFRFSDESTALLFKNSEIYQILLAELKTFSLRHAVDESMQEEALIEKGLVEVFITKVNPEKKASYKAWSAKVHKMESEFPGFCGVYLQSLGSEPNDYWLTLLQFDTKKNLENWLNSQNRKELLEEAKDLVISMENHRVISPYEGWFSSITQSESATSVIKQTMLVLLVLFPIIMLEFKFLSPLTSSVNLSLATFIGNAVSVSLIAFPFMPIAIYFLGWWLKPISLKKTILGTVVLLCLYLLEIAFFWDF